MRLFAMRTGNTVTVHLDGEHRQIICESEEEAIELFAKAMKVKNSTEQEDFDAFRKFIDPSYRLGEIGCLERDRMGNYFLAGYKEPMPSALVLKLKEYYDNDLSVEPLINFWKLLMLNPDLHVRESLFNFAERFHFPITDYGYFIAYKSVAWKGESEKEMALMIASEYIYKKAAGKDTSNIYVAKLLNPKESEGDEYQLIDADEYEVGEDELLFNVVEEALGEEKRIYIDPYAYAAMSTDERTGLIKDEDEDSYYRLHYSYPEFEELGSLETMYQSMITRFNYDVPTFTDHHTRRSTIRLGELQSMDREECDNNPAHTCSKGLHVGAPGYVQGFGGYDSYVIACLVSPANVVAVPEDYNFEKMRTCEYYPYAVCKMENGQIREVDTRYFEVDYKGWEDQALEQELEHIIAINSELNGTVSEESDQVKLIKDRLTLVGNAVN